MEFKVGDRVKAIHAVDDNEYVAGKLGVIKDVMSGDPIQFGVEFDDPVDGHCCNSCEAGKGWWCTSDDLVLVTETPPVKKLLFIEDGSIDPSALDDLYDRDPTIFVIVYRQGSKPPILVDVEGKK